MLTKLALRAIPPTCLMVSVVAGWPIWRADAPLKTVPLEGWVWLYGSFAAFAGGVMLFPSSRLLAATCTLGGFAVFLTAALHLTHAVRTYHEQFRGIS
jgi:predicted membrane channel-forming protein YqfA (hemolysin III family)